MNVAQWIGVALLLIGLAEIALFGQLARTRANIAAKRQALYLNSFANIIIGVVLFLLFM
jgi:hypothetical protein